jgi:hypothetical protein
MHRENVARQNAYEQYGVVVCRFGPARDELSRIYIEISLLVGLLGCRARCFKHTLLSVIGLTGATIFYVLWWQYYFKLAEISGSNLQFVRHPGYLYNANYLDICIAAGISWVILLHLRRELLSLFRPSST